MKKTKIVIPALAVLLLSTAASVSGTVAWFSMNNSVSVTGMTVSTKVSSNLLIAETNLDANYTDSIDQPRSGILEPASSINGQNFFFTTTARPDGNAINPGYKTYAEATNALGENDATASGKTYYDSTFNHDYDFAYSTDSTPATPDDDDGLGNGQVAFAYMDYSFYLKATAATSGLSLSMTKCDLKYKVGSEYVRITNENGAGYAWRVGMFAATANANQELADSSVAVQGNLKTILDFGARTRNQNEVELVDVAADASLADKYNDPKCQTPVGGTAPSAGKYYALTQDGQANTNKGTPKAASGANAISAVLNAGSDAIVAQSSSNGQSLLYKVVVRLWLEGEDVTCTNNTYANLTEDWKLDLEFKLGDASVAEYAPVNEIGPAQA